MLAGHRVAYVLVGGAAIQWVVSPTLDQMARRRSPRADPLRRRQPPSRRTRLPGIFAPDRAVRPAALQGWRPPRLRNQGSDRRSQGLPSRPHRTRTHHRHGLHAPLRNRTVGSASRKHRPAWSPVDGSAPRAAPSIALPLTPRGRRAVPRARAPPRYAVQHGAWSRRDADPSSRAPGRRRAAETM